MYRIQIAIERKGHVILNNLWEAERKILLSRLLIFNRVFNANWYFKVEKIKYWDL